jgi:hypothetical protein
MQGFGKFKVYRDYLPQSMSIKTPCQTNRVETSNSIKVLKETTEEIIQKENKRTKLKMTERIG